MTDDTDERGEEYVARQRGGDHLPECMYDSHAESYSNDWCICNELRACEARVRLEPTPEDDLTIHDAKVRAAALDAARNAVAALGRYAMPEDWLVGVDRKVVLAAIDALKGEQP